MKTAIRFVIFNKEILGVFMRRNAGIWFDGKRWVRDCYARIGQHSHCYDGMQKRKKATPGQYRPLKEEMESIGYQLKII